MKVSRKVMLLFCSFCVFFSCVEELPKEFKIYLRENRYNDEIGSLSSSYDNIETYKYLGGYSIDPKNKGEIDVTSTVQTVQRMYPDKDATGFLAINLEGELYKNIRNFPVGNEKCDFAVKQYQLLVETVKKERPNVKVGIYGFPFSFYYDSQRKSNANNKLDPILSMCDYISPSLYSAYPKREIGEKRTEQYLKDNLIYLLELGQRLEKPVIPYIWHFVHPSNDKYGGEVLSVSEMIDNLKYIANFTHNNQRVSGVIWWESSETGRQSLFKRTKQFESQGLTNPDASDLLMDYLKAINPKYKN